MGCSLWAPHCSHCPPHLPLSLWSFLDVQMAMTLHVGHPELLHEPSWASEQPKVALAWYSACARSIWSLSGLCAIGALWTSHGPMGVGGLVTPGGLQGQPHSLCWHWLSHRDTGHPPAPATPSTLGWSPCGWDKDELRPSWHWEGAGGLL